MSVLGPGLFRLLLAGLVVLSHVSSFEIGRPAVFLFFMLSGYWVLRMYDEKYSAATDVIPFYLSRLLRIWPAFAIAFLLTFAVRYLQSGVAETDMLSGLLLFGVATTKQDMLGVSWSLDIELQFYLLVPLIAVALARSRSAIWLGFATVAALILGWIIQLSFGVVTVFSYLPCFLAGALLWRTRTIVSTRMGLVSVAAFLGVGAVVFALPELRTFLIKGQHTPFPVDWFGMLWAATLLPFIAWNVAQKSGAADRMMGDFSFALYIVHWPIINMMRGHLDMGGTTDRAILATLILTVSLIFFFGVDRPIERFRQRCFGTPAAKSVKERYTPLPAPAG